MLSDLFDLKTLETCPVAETSRREPERFVVDGDPNGGSSAAGDAQQGSHVEREQSGVPARLRRTRHAGVR